MLLFSTTGLTISYTWLSETPRPVTITLNVREIQTSSDGVSRSASPWLAGDSGRPGAGRIDAVAADPPVYSSRWCVSEDSKGLGQPATRDRMAMADRAVVKAVPDGLLTDGG
jgi:hypothetical protein